MDIYDVPLRRTKNRVAIIDKVELFCKERNIAILIDLNCYPKAMLTMLFIKLQIVESNPTSEGYSQHKQPEEA